MFIREYPPSIYDLWFLVWTNRRIIQKMSEDVDPFNLSNRSRKKQSSGISPRTIIENLIAV